MSSKTYDFDQVINRKETNAMALKGYRGYLFDLNEDLSGTGEYKEEDFIPMWVADMELAIAPEIIDAMQKRLEHPLLGYTMVANPSYPLAFQKWCSDRYEWNFDLDHLLYSKGVIPALYSLIGQLCKPDEQVLIVTPSYAFFKHGADYNGIELVCSELIIEQGKYVMNMKDISAKAGHEKCVLAIFCNPHNPTGRVWSKEELQKFGEICLDNGLTIISDEIHCDLLRTHQSFIPMAKLFPNSDKIITCMAPSKTFNLAGNLFANLIISNQAIRNEYIKNYSPVENPLSIVAAQAAYTDGHKWLIELKVYLDANFNYLKEQLETHLPETNFFIPEATYLAWVNVSHYFSANENLTLFFARNSGVLLEGGNMFVANAEGYIRLNVACPRSRLKEGLHRIIKAIKQK